MTEAADDAGTSEPPLRSVHTTSFAQILNRLGISLAVTTYQAGKLVLLRPEPRPDGPVLNTHFRGFNKPMGFAWEPGRFAVGTNAEVWEFHNIPAVAPKLDTPESPVPHDGAYLPRACHVTGDIQIHEMAWLPPEDDSGAAHHLSDFLSCGSSTRDSRAWRHAAMFTALSHDGSRLLSRDLRRRIAVTSMGWPAHGKLQYITALGETDKPAGWRENKRAGGILMDVPSNEIIVRGLSMPHSPRWHNGLLWLLESGNGSVGVVDPKKGEYQEICRLPGFTRGIDFAGPYAFIGLSQVRESAVFSGIAIAEMPQADRCCGVWAIDTRSGQVAGFVKFTDAVQEVFAVQVLRGCGGPMC